MRSTNRTPRMDPIIRLARRRAPNTMRATTRMRRAISMGAVCTRRADHRRNQERTCRSGRSRSIRPVASRHGITGHYLPPRQSRIRRLTSDGAAPPPPHRSRHSSRPLPCLRRDGAPAGAAHEARGSHPLGPCQRVAPSLSATAQSLPSHQTSLRRAPSPPGRLRMYRGRGVVRRRSLAVGAARPVGWAAMRTLRRGWRARRATAANAASAATAAERGAEACGLCAGGCVIG